MLTNRFVTNTSMKFAYGRTIMIDSSVLGSVIEKFPNKFDNYWYRASEGVDIALSAKSSKLLPNMAIAC